MSYVVSTFCESDYTVYIHIYLSHPISNEIAITLMLFPHFVKVFVEHPIFYVPKIYDAWRLTDQWFLHSLHFSNELCCFPILWKWLHSLQTYIFISPNLKWTSYNSYVVSPFCECFVGLGSIFGEEIVSESTNPLSPRVWNFGQNNSSNKDRTYDANCFIIAWHFCQPLCHPE